MESIKNYKTKQRDLIINFLKENISSHVTAEQIINYLKVNNTPVGKSTVYRFLNILQKQNKIRKYNIKDTESNCYQFIDKEECEEHYHLKCDECGELIHMDCNFFQEVGQHVFKEHKFKIDSLKTVLYGTCNKCSKNKEKGDKNK